MAFSRFPLITIFLVLDGPISLKSKIQTSTEIKKTNDLVFVGTLTKSFDLNIVIKIFINSKIKSVFHIIGDGPELAKLRENFKNDSNIKFYGFLNQSEYLKILDLNHNQKNQLQ